MCAAAISLSSDSIAFIEHRYRLQNSRTCRLETPEGSVMVKGQRPARDRVRFWILNQLSKFLKNPMMKPVPLHGGTRSQSVEVQRLRALAAAGVSVPRVLYETEQYFVMQAFDATPLDSRLALPSHQSTPAFERGLDAISVVHGHGAYLSQGFARNILINNDGSVWFVDHEDNPLEVLTLTEAQARDWLLYLHSAVWLNPELWGEWRPIWSNVFRHLPDDVRGRILSSTLSLRWLRHLPQNRALFGRDLLQVKAVVEFFESL